MNTFAPLFEKILDSSVWQEPYHVRILWTAMLVLKDSDHVVRYNAFNLASRANMTEAEVLEALKVLSEPDTRRLEPQPHGGRRIERVEDGWLILNGQQYEDEMRRVSRRIYKARKEREYRERKRQALLGTTAAERAVAAAETPEAAARAEELLQGLPPGALAGNGAAAAPAPVESKPGHRVIVFKPQGAA